jgi:hypothetical protein
VKQEEEIPVIEEDESQGSWLHSEEMESAE